jgi:hypothetical protein
MAEKTIAERIKYLAVTNNETVARMHVRAVAFGGKMPGSFDRYHFPDGSVLTRGEIERIGDRSASHAR